MIAGKKNKNSDSRENTFFGNISDPSDFDDTDLEVNDNLTAEELFNLPLEKKDLLWKVVNDDVHQTSGENQSNKRNAFPL